MTSTTASLPTAPAAPLLRQALALDAVVTGANGVAYLALAGPLAELLGLEAGLLRGVGAFLVAFAAVVWLAGRRSRAAVAGIVAANVAWAAASVVAVLAGWGTPSTAGAVWIVLQAVVVAGFAELQLVGLRRARR